MAETLRKCASVLEKDFTIDVFFIRNFERQNKNFARKKKFFCNADADADVNANADAEMSMRRFANDLFLPNDIIS